MDLLVLAAGMGSRFGGLKQIEPVGPNGEFILDYSIYDAIKAGFKRVVFVIKEENYELFKSTIGERVSKYIEVEYAFQKLEDIPIPVPEGRVKPWGTVQAILCAKDKIKSNFAVINADDFYGRESFEKAFNVLNDLNQENIFSSVLYKAKNTLSENGKVKRGLCVTDENEVKKLIECEIHEDKDELICEPLDGSEMFIESTDMKTSMNMFLFNKSIFSLLDKIFNSFFDNLKDELKGECLISTVIDEEINKGSVVLKYVDTNAKWYGITYKEDLESLKNGINELINSGEYNKNLWS